MAPEKSSLRIGITCYPTWGGSGVLATELGKQLALLGHEIHFISYAMPHRLKSYNRNIYFHEVQLSSYPLFEYQPYTLALAVKMHEAILEFDLDLLHVHYAIPHATSAWIAKQMLGQGHRVRIVTTLHGTDVTLVGQEESFKTITRFSIEQSDGVTAVSEFLRRQTLDIFQVEKTIQVIPNFVDTEVFRHRREYDYFRQQLASKGEKIVMHISNLRPLKRVKDVVLVFAEVAGKIPARLIIVGDGPERFGAFQLAQELGLEEKCSFLGAQESVACLLNCADLVLQPSATESFGLVILEALSMGVPVVATRCGGPEEVVLHGENGYLAEVGDIAGMSGYCLRLLTDRNLHQSFSLAARARAVDFDINSVVGRYEAFYRAVTAG